MVKIDIFMSLRLSLSSKQFTFKLPNYKSFHESQGCVENSSVVKIYIIIPKPGPVAKNATSRPSGWESNPRPLDYWTSALPLSYRCRYRQLGRESSICINEMVMPVNYKSILIIIFGIYTRCQ